MTQVWVLVISHKHGTDFWAFTTLEGARARLYNYVEEWWGREVPHQDMPEDHDEAIEKYFMEVDEDYELGPCDVEGAVAEEKAQ